MNEFEEMKTILAKNKEEWKKKHNAYDISIGVKEVNGEIIDDELCFKFWVDEKKDVTTLTEDELVPQILEEKQTDVKKDVIFQVQEGTGRIRPVEMGWSICNITGTAGSPGAVYMKSGQYFILSNAHVGGENPFIYVSQQEVRNVQPGPHHGGKYPDDFLANMRYMVMLNDHSNSDTESLDITKVDAYIERIDGTLVLHQTAPNTVDNCLIGPLKYGSDVITKYIYYGFAPDYAVHIAKPGDKGILNSWRMDAISEFTVTDVGRQIRVQHKNGKIAVLIDQIVTTKCGEPGTSGSGMLVVLDDGKTAFMGLNHAGSNTMNVCCPIQHTDVAFGGRVMTKNDIPNDDVNVHKIIVELKPIVDDNGIWKIDGKVQNINNKHPISGANFILDGIVYATDNYGEVFIDNISPGEHNVVVEANGYETSDNIDFIL